MNEFSNLITESWKHKLFLDGAEIEGIQNIEFNAPIPIQNYDYLGFSPVPLFNGNKVANISITKQIFADDIIFSYTGSSGFNGLILENNQFNVNNLGFTSGYLTNYSINVQKNQPIEASCNFAIFGNYGQMEISDSLFNYYTSKIAESPKNYFFLGPVRLTNNSTIINDVSGFNLSNKTTTGDFLFVSGGATNLFSGSLTGFVNNNLILSNSSNANTTGILYKKKENRQISANSISISLDEFNTNLVNSFNFNVGMPRVPVYCLNRDMPYEIHSITPLDVNCSLEMDLNNYQFEKLKLYPTGFYKIQNLNVQLRDYLSGHNLMAFNFNNLFLTEHNYSLQADGNVKISLNYSNKN